MNISKEFMVESGIVYPPFATDFFERYFYNYVKNFDNEVINYKYLPIFWTELYISSYNNRKLQSELDKLKNNDYFAVVQHDDGIREILPNGTRVYFMGGNGEKGGINASETIIIPLIYDNPDILKPIEGIEKRYLVSFVGAITHKCRLDVVNELKSKPDVILFVDKWTNNISKSKQDIFIETTRESKFTMAPRGYGATSFRLYEALKLGSIPVYVYDVLWLPYQEIIDWNKMIVLVHISEINGLYERLKDISDEEIEEKLRYYEEYKELFTCEGVAKYILERELRYN